eukprot:g52752.t1
MQPVQPSKHSSTSLPTSCSVFIPRQMSVFKQEHPCPHCGEMYGSRTALAYHTHMISNVQCKLSPYNPNSVNYREPIVTQERIPDGSWRKE